MSAHANPDIIDDGLVFLYDTDDGKSYKGEPTVNLATDSPSQGGWAGGREVLDSSRKKFRFIVDNFNASAGSGQGWRSFTWDLNSYSGQSVTISATVEVPSASPGTFAWIMMGQTNTHTSNNSGAGQYMGYSASSERVQKTTTTTEHITWTGTVGSTGTASQPSGHVGFTLWYNGGTIGVDSYVEVSNVQIEINSHATQFVNGTRSAAQGLIDRTGTSTINISNASFDSNAQMTFDGTDDYVNVDHESSYDTNVFTIEAWFKSTADDNTHDSIVTRNGDVYSSTNGWSLGKLRNGLGDTQNALRWMVWGTSAYTSLLGDSATTGNWIHAVGVSDGSTLYLYQNGVLKTSSSKPAGNIYPASYGLKVGANKSGSDVWNGHINSLKMYNKALTSTEVLQNFNATKDRFGL
jgi:hypothetical protein